VAFGLEIENITTEESPKILKQLEIEDSFHGGQNQKFLGDKEEVMKEGDPYFRQLGLDHQHDHEDEIFEQPIKQEQEQERGDKIEGEGEGEGEGKGEEGEEGEAEEEEELLNGQDRIKALLRKELKIHQKEDPEFYRRFPGTLERLQNFTEGNWEIYFEYPPFRSSLPHFLRDEDRTRFLTNPSTKHKMPSLDENDCANHEGEYYQHGGFALLENVTLTRIPLCYWNSLPSDHQINKPARHYVEMAALLLAPESERFQHFMDGALPKIIHTWPLSRKFKIISNNYTSQPMIKAVMDLLGLDPMTHPFGGLKIRHFLFGCRAPGLNPELWHKMHYLITEKLIRELEEAGEIPRPDPNRIKIMYLPRGHSPKNGRNVLNNEEVVQALQQFSDAHSYELDILKTEEIGTDLRKVVKKMEGTTVAVGPHGGSMYNIFFARMGLSLVEFLTTGHAQHDFHNIFWHYSELLGAKFYRVYVHTDKPKDDVVIDPNLVVHAVREAIERRNEPERCASWKFA